MHQCSIAVHECTSAVHECTSAPVHERTGNDCANATADAGSESRQGEKEIHRFGSTHKHNGAPDGVDCRPAASASEQQRQQGSKQRRAAGGSNSASRASGAASEQQASSKQRRATSSEGEAVRPSLDCLNGEDPVLSTGKEVFLVVDHSLNVLHGVVGLNLEGRDLTVAVLRKICIPLRGWSVE